MKVTLLLHDFFSLAWRQSVNSFCLLGLQLDLIVDHLAKANLLIDNVNKQQRNDGNDQEWCPPTGAPAKVGEGLLGAKKV